MDWLVYPTIMGRLRVIARNLRRSSKLMFGGTPNIARAPQRGLAMRSPKKRDYGFSRSKAASKALPLGVKS
jgi:hypothetical protein